MDIVIILGVECICLVSQRRKKEKGLEINTGNGEQKEKNVYEIDNA